MKYVAYKVSRGNPNLPDGFITEHFETDDPNPDGYYTVVSKEAFSSIVANNVDMYRSFEQKKGIIVADPNSPPPVLRPASEAELPDPALQAKQKAASAQAQADADLFKQFLAWKAAQNNNS